MPKRAGTELSRMTRLWEIVRLKGVFMSSNLQVFSNSEFGDLSVLMIEDNPYFPATACARLLGFSNPQEAVRTHCKGVRKALVPSAGGRQEANFIPANDLYRLVVRSKLPGVERFKSWVFNELLPFIRKHYNATDHNTTDSAKNLEISRDISTDSNLQIFNNGEFGEIRALEINGQAWFIGKDVAEALGYERPTKAVGDHVDSEDVDGVPIQDSIGRYQTTPIINESGLYSLIMSSKLPKAKEFKHWVTSEVLPSIRKHGAYMTATTLDGLMSDPKSWIRLLTVLDEERTAKEQLQLEAEFNAPKVIFADAVTDSDCLILIGELAKILKGNGIEIGQNRLFAKLREDGYLIKRKGLDHNMPTQMAMDLGLFMIEEKVLYNRGGLVVKTVRVTGKGQQYFVNRFLSEARNCSESVVCGDDEFVRSSSWS